MKNLVRDVVILVGISCFAAIGFNAAEAQTKNSAKTAKIAVTSKIQKPPAKTPPKPAIKSSEKSQTKAAVVKGSMKAPAKPTPKTSDSSAASKQANKTNEKSKNLTKTKSLPVKLTVALNKTPANSKEKTIKTKNSNPTRAAKTTLAARIEPKITTKSNDAPKITAKPSPKISGSSQVIVATTSARLRSAPDAKADTVSTVNIGKILTVVEEKPAWSRVQLSNDKSGWISKSIISDFNEEKRDGIYRTILGKYFKSDKLNFADAAQIFDFLKTGLGQVKNNSVQADLNFKRLVALKTALAAIPFSKGAQSPYKEFLDANAAETVYSEPSAEWLVRSDVIWELHGRYKDFAVGEEIAWLGARNPLPGECEGYVNCYLYLLRVTEGEYLNFYPNGKYSKKALQNINATLEPITADLKNKAIYMAPTDISDRAEFNRLLTELRTIISKVPHVEKAQTIKQINQIGEGFR